MLLSILSIDSVIWISFLEGSDVEWVVDWTKAWDRTIPCYHYGCFAITQKSPTTAAFKFSYCERECLPCAKLPKYDYTHDGPQTSSDVYEDKLVLDSFMATALTTLTSSCTISIVCSPRLLNTIKKFWLKSCDRQTSIMYLTEYLSILTNLLCILTSIHMHNTTISIIENNWLTVTHQVQPRDYAALYLLITYMFSIELSCLPSIPNTFPPCRVFLHLRTRSFCLGCMYWWSISVL